MPEGMHLACESAQIGKIYLLSEVPSQLIWRNGQLYCSSTVLSSGTSEAARGNLISEVISLEWRDTAHGNHKLLIQTFVQFSINTSLIHLGKQSSHLLEICQPLGKLFLSVLIPNTRLSYWFIGSA